MHQPDKCTTLLRPIAGTSRRVALTLSVLLATSLAAGPYVSNGSAEVPRGAPVSTTTTPTASFEQVTFTDLPGWDTDDHLTAFKAFP